MELFAVLDVWHMASELTILETSLFPQGKKNESLEYNEKRLKEKLRSQSRFSVNISFLFPSFFSVNVLCNVGFGSHFR